MKKLGGLVPVLLFVGLFAVGLDALGLDAKKIAQIRADETLWQFLVKLPSSFEAQVFYALVLSGAAGLIGSWLWKVSQGQADFRHFTGRYCLAQLLWLIGSSIAAIFTVGFQTEDGVFFGWLAVLWSGGFAGFSGDVKVKEARQAWTDEQRAAAEKKDGAG